MAAKETQEIRDIIERLKKLEAERNIQPADSEPQRCGLTGLPLTEESESYRGMRRHPYVIASKDNLRQAGKAAAEIRQADKGCSYFFAEDGVSFSEWADEIIKDFVNSGGDVINLPTARLLISRRNR